VDGVTYASKLVSRLWLFQNYGTGARPTPWTGWTAADQITDIINFAHTTNSVNIQAGEIDPPMMMPAFGVTSQTCAECINLMLQSLPDVSTGIDYTTTPPTLSALVRQNCTPVTLPYAGVSAGGQIHTSSIIRSRDDLQIPQVVINYRSANVTDGVSYNLFTTDAYPPDSDGTARNSVIQDFDLRGATRSSVKGVVTAVATDPTTTDFWEAVKPDLASDDIFDLAVIGGSVTVKDDSGNRHLLGFFHQQRLDF
jgi:hypothetical protein